MIEFNKVFLCGRLTRDPELKYLPSGTAVCEMRIASGRNYTERASGERKEETLFINVTAWTKTAEFCNEYMHKGSAIFIEGRLKHETWTDKEGKNRERISVVADRVQFGESKAEAQARGSGSEGGSYSREESAPGPAAASTGAESQGGSESTDDLPF